MKSVGEALPVFTVTCLVQDEMGTVAKIFFFLTLDNYPITTMKNITDDPTADNSTCLMRIHV